MGKQMTGGTNSIDRERARLAFKCVEEVNKDDIGKKYASYVRRLPYMILSAGLAQSLAFVYSKQKGNSLSAQAYKKVLDHLMEAFSQDYVPLPEVKNKNIDEFVREIINLPSEKYRMAEREALAFLQWLRRFATAQFGEVDQKE